MRPAAVNSTMSKHLRLQIKILLKYEEESRFPSKIRYEDLQNLFPEAGDKEFPYCDSLTYAVKSLLAPWSGREAIVWVVDMAAIGTACGYLHTCLATFSVARNRWPRTVALLGALFYFGRAREYAAISGPELDRLILGGSGSSTR